MSGSLKIHLKANERIFVNGAVIRFDRKVALEFLNEVVFLLEAHVMQQEDAKTPLRQLYFVVQSMIMEPGTVKLAQQIFDQQYRGLITTFKDQEVLEALVAIRELVGRNKVYEALRQIRALFPIEAKLLGSSQSPAVLEQAIA